MPHKFNGRHRHKFAKKKYRVTNWRAYNESLRNRGYLTIWITTDALKHWVAPRRQTQGLMRNISKLMQLEVSVPDFSTLSRRGRDLILPVRPKTKRTDQIHLAVDSTGLKIFGVGEWLQKKHKTGAKRKKWRKLHLGLDLTSGEIICADLTKDNVGDPSALPCLLDQVGVPVSHFLADGAYDGAPTGGLLQERFG